MLNTRNPVNVQKNIYPTNPCPEIPCKRLLNTNVPSTKMLNPKFTFNLFSKYKKYPSNLFIIQKISFTDFSRCLSFFSKYQKYPSNLFDLQKYPSLIFQDAFSFFQNTKNTFHFFSLYQKYLHSNWGCSTLKWHARTHTHISIYRDAPYYAMYEAFENQLISNSLAELVEND